MTPTAPRTVPVLTVSAVLAAAGLMLAGCSSPPTPAATDPAASASASPSTSASPAASPASALSAAEQEAFEQATAVVMAYNQTYTDLYTGARTRINDLDNYATGDKLDRDRTNVQLGLASGRRGEPLGAQLVLVSAEPAEVDLAADPATVVVRACIDFTAVTDILPDGTRTPGGRAEYDYTVVRTTYLPDPGWAVSRIQGDRDPEDRTC
jgi:hypothetical protein